MATPEQLADELLDLIFEGDPVRASIYGDRTRDDLLPDLSAAAEQSRRAQLEDVRRRAMAVDTEHAELEQRLTIAVVVHQAEAAIDRIDSRSVEYGINGSLFAPVSGLLGALARVSVTDADQARAFLRRLAAIPRFTETVVQRHREGLATGMLPVQPLVEEAVDQLDRLLAAPGTDPLLEQDMHGLDAERRELLDEVVHPALRRYRDVLATEVAPASRPADKPGLCWLPSGRDIYRRLVRSHTTTQRTPQELHETGLRIGADLRREYAELGARALGVSDPAELTERLRSDPALRWRDADDLLTTARDAISRAEAAAPDWFGRLPSQGCEVRSIPPSSGRSTGDYYTPPALDGSRPGIYFAATDRAAERVRYTAEVIAFHEAVPGHHFQLTLAQELTGLPRLRRLLAINAYTEGWGLYTERLADEMGLYSGDLARIGMVSEDSLRAARLVVDTGIHEFGWSRQQAVDHMLEHTTLPPPEVAAEVDRYIQLPGQALSYMVGRLEIERIRAAARDRLGADFDIRAFHDAVLGHGALPLSTVDMVVASG
ncbi:DUF885 domain-containing protein [Saccharopolyspora taberi]|uniref:DUF885 domain-containing protein n=1 Tax=Saccharopolyspora taberi TaxID=60895 RepID=A0ABN3VLH4_9PSEU